MRNPTQVADAGRPTVSAGGVGRVHGNLKASGAGEASCDATGQARVSGPAGPGRARVQPGYCPRTALTVACDPSDRIRPSLIVAPASSVARTSERSALEAIGVPLAETTTSPR